MNTEYAVVINKVENGYVLQSHDAEIKSEVNVFTTFADMAVWLTRHFENPNNE